MFTCSKRYEDIPFAHRQPNHKGHCRHIHGHNWSFEFMFGCTERDECGFVIDFGDLGWLKSLLDGFDHALVLNRDDPYLEAIGTELVSRDVARIVVVQDCSSEGLAAHFFYQVEAFLEDRYGGRVFLHSVTVEEDYKNAASFTPERTFGRTILEEIARGGSDE